MKRKGIVFSIDALLALLLVMVSVTFFFSLISMSNTDITNVRPYVKLAESKSLVQGTYNKVAIAENWKPGVNYSACSKAVYMDGAEAKESTFCVPSN